MQNIMMRHMFQKVAYCNNIDNISYFGLNMVELI